MKLVLELTGTAGTKLRVDAPTEPGSFPPVGLTVGDERRNLPPSWARQIAAALLTAADEADRLQR